MEKEKPWTHYRFVEMQEKTDWYGYSNFSGDESSTIIDDNRLTREMNYISSISFRLERFYFEF